VVRHRHHAVALWPRVLRSRGHAVAALRSACGAATTRHCLIFGSLGSGRGWQLAARFAAAEPPGDRKAVAEDREKDNKIYIIIGVCVVVFIAIIIVAVFVASKRRQSTDKHSLLMSQRSVMSHDGGEQTPSYKGRENLAYTYENTEEKNKDGFMFEMPSNLKSTK